MVSMKDRFKGTGLFRAADFEDVSDDGLDLVIDHLELDVSVGANYRDVVYFQDDGLGLVLNQTNAHMIEKLYGDSDEWPGRPLNLYLDRTVTYNDQPKPGIRVRAPHARGSSDNNPALPQMKRQSGPYDIPRTPADPAKKPATVQHDRQERPPFDDDIPF